jgi:glycerophosphoryl diester phosphodiesterase
MAEYTEHLSLFKPGTDDNVGVETSLNDNFMAIDTKLGDGITDRTGYKYTSLGDRLNTEQAKYDIATTDVAKLKKKVPNVKLNDHYFRTVAHRGFSYVAPENTLAAFRKAIDAGFWGIETDIQLTSDNKWVVIHDTTIDRTSNSTGAVNTKTLATLRGLDFGSWFNATLYKDELIPTLDEFLWICKAGNVVPYIEIKGTYTDIQMQDLVNIIREHGMENDAVVIGFSLASLQKIRFYSEVLALGYLSSTFTQTVVNDTVALGNAFLDVAYAQVTTANMDMAQAAGILVEAWTVDSNASLRNLLKLGVRGVTTNRISFGRGY